MAEEDVATARSSRRQLLKVGAVGAGVAGAAWVSPSMLKMDQAFAVVSSCSTASNLNWPGTFAQGAPGTTSAGSLANYNPGGTPPGWVAFGPGSDGQTVRFLLTTLQTPSRLVFFPDNTYPAFNTGVQPGTRSGVTGFYSMLMTDAATGQGARLVITFSKKVSRLDLPLIEITADGSGNNDRYTDRMTVTGYNNYGGVGGTQATVPITTTFVGNDVTTAIAANTLSAIGDAAPTNTSASSVTARLTGPMDAVVIDYTQARTGVPSNQGAYMFAGIGDLSWLCV